MNETLLYILKDLKPSALRYCNYNVPNAEDLLSDLCVKWLEVSYKYDHLPFIEIKRILNRSLTNLFLDKKRRAKCQPFVVTDYIPDRVDEIADDKEEVILYNRIMSFLEKEAGQKYKALLLYNKGLMVKDIAKLLNSNTNTISGQIRYARRDVKRIFREGKQIRRLGRQPGMARVINKQEYKTEREARQFIIQSGIIKRRKKAA